MKLVVYYSLDGNTKYAAEELVSLLGADMLRIDTQMRFPDSKAGKLFIGGFLTVFGFRPELKKNKIRPEKYDTVIIGSPVWAGKCAAPVSTFLEENDLSKKDLYFFSTSMSGDDKSFFENLKRKAGTPLAELSLKNPLENKESVRSKIEEFAEKIKQRN
jgi:flavodoxin